MAGHLKGTAVLGEPAKIDDITYSVTVTASRPSKGLSPPTCPMDNSAPSPQCMAHTVKMRKEKRDGQSLKKLEYYSMCWIPTIIDWIESMIRGVAISILQEILRYVCIIRRQGWTKDGGSFGAPFLSSRIAGKTAASRVKEPAGLQMTSILRFEK